MTYIPKPAKVYRDPRKRSAVNAEGRIGKAQRAWNAAELKRMRFEAQERGEKLGCAVCGRQFDLQIGHIIARGRPLSNGPELRMNRSNIAPICGTCNGYMDRDRVWERQTALPLMLRWALDHSS